MAAQSLLATMASQVEAECEEHVAQARAEADTILADARAKAGASREAALAAAQAEKERLDTLWRQKAEAESIRLELAMKNEAVEAVLSAVRDELRRIAEGPEFRGLLERLLEELMEAAGDRDDVVVLGPPSQTDSIKQWLSGHGKGGVSVEGSQAFWDGVAVQDPNRTYRISNTLSRRFAQVEPDIRKHCMTTLFGSEGGA